MAARGTYRRIAQELRDQVRSGFLGPGAMLPSEMALVEQHGVSRGTIRSALALLVDEGLVEVVQGQGRRVVGGSDVDHATAMYRRIASDLARRLQSGEFRSADLLPSESALVAEYGVARSTIRRSYRMLVDDGLVVIRQGVGAFPTSG